MLTTEQHSRTTIVARRLSAKSLYKLIFVSGLIPGAAFFLFVGISAANGAETLQLNGSYVTGTKAIFIALAMYLPCLALFSGLTWLIAAPGLYLWSLFKPLRLEFKAD